MQPFGRWEDLKIHCDEIKAQIEDIVISLDPVELLSKVSYLMHFISQDENDLSYSLKERPILYFLTSIIMSSDQKGVEIVDDAKVNEVIEVSDRYFTTFLQMQMAQLIDAAEDSQNMNNVVFEARNLKLISDVNPEGYIFQFEVLISELLSEFDEFFLENVGFTASNAWVYSLKILTFFIEEAQKQKPIKEMFVFQIEDFCRVNEVSDRNQFLNYLNALSCDLTEKHNFTGSNVFGGKTDVGKR